MASFAERMPSAPKFLADNL